MAKKKKSNAESLAARRRERELKQQKISDIVAYIVSGIAIAAIVGLIIYSYAR